MNARRLLGLILLVSVSTGSSLGAVGHGAAAQAELPSGAMATIQVDKLNADSPTLDDQFGYSVAVSGDTVVVGATEDDEAATNAGAAYVFQRNQGGRDEWGLVQKLTASDGGASEKFGFSVSISGDTVAVGAQQAWSELGGTGVKSGAVYIFERNQDGADSWGQVDKVAAGDALLDDRFGTDVCISDDTVVVGAYNKNSATGAAYIFQRNKDGADNWGQVQKLTASDAYDGDRFGDSVAISGDTIVIGADWNDDVYDRSGSAYVFERNKDTTPSADNWGQVKKLTAGDPYMYDQFGRDVSISGDTIVVGSFLDDDGATNAGSAYIFERNQGGAEVWGQVAKLTASDPSQWDRFGGSVCISGDRAVVGAIEKDGDHSGPGYACVFERNQGGADEWGQAAKLAAGDPGTEDEFGYSVGISGDTIVVGARYDDDGADDSGSAYVFSSGGAWMETGKPTADDAAENDWFGICVSASGDKAIVGAYNKNTDYGAAYIYYRNEDGADAWGQVEDASLVSDDLAAGDRFGCAVGISGDTAVVGAGRDHHGAYADAGAAYVFERNKDTPMWVDHWGQVQKLIPDDPASSDLFGYAVDIDGDTAVVGAYNKNSGAGAAYVFERNQDSPTLADNWGQVQKLVSGDGSAPDEFGRSVSISGDTIVVGAPDQYTSPDESGAAYIYYRNQGGADSWGKVKKLTASTPATGDFFGYSVSVSGDTTAVGAYGEGTAGAAYVFERNQGGSADNWGQVKKLSGDDSAAGDEFGFSVDIDVDTVVVGAYKHHHGGDNDPGAAYVFERNVGGADNWGQMTKLTASDADALDWFGYSVSIGDGTVIVGALRDDHAYDDAGSSYVYQLGLMEAYAPLALKRE